MLIEYGSDGNINGTTRLLMNDLHIFLLLIYA